MDARGPVALQLRTPASLDQLARHPWPGNVRELRNYLERCLATRETPPLEPASGVEAPEIDVGEPLRAARDRWMRHFERRYLEALLDEHDGNVSAAARAAGVARVYFYRLLSRAGIAPQSR